MKKRIFIILILLVTIVSSCQQPVNSDQEDSKKENTDQEVPKKETIESADGIINEKVLILEDESDNIENIDIDSGQVTISSSNDIEAGNILSLGVTENTPNGFLAVVESVEDNGDSKKLKVREASIEEAFEELDIKIDSSFSPDDEDVRFIPSIDGVSFIRPGSRDIDNLTLANGKMTLQLVDVQLHGSGNNKILLNGKIEVEASIIFDFSLQEERMEFSITPSVTDTLTLTGNYDSSNIQKEVELGKVTKKFQFVVNGLPVYITTEFFLNAGFDGKVTADLESEVSARASFSAGLEYNGEWDTNYENEVSFTYKPPTINSELFARAYIKPGFRLWLYNTVGPEISWEPYIKLNATCLAQFGSFKNDSFFNPEWTLYGGHAVNAGCNVKFMNFFNESFDFDFPIKEKVLLSSIKPPTSLQIKGGTTGVVLTWDTVNEASTYEVYRSLSKDSGFTLVGVVVTPTFTDFSINENSLTYYYRVKAASPEMGQSPPSSAVNNSNLTTTPDDSTDPDNENTNNAPSAPSDLKITYLEDEPRYDRQGNKVWKVELSWTKSVDPDNDVIYYTIHSYDKTTGYTGYLTAEDYGKDNTVIFYAKCGIEYNLTVVAKDLKLDALNTSYEVKSDALIFTPKD